MGYTIDEISLPLQRIYKEQSGGSFIVRNDRRHRRGLIKTTLARLGEDKTQTLEFRQLAEATLLFPERMSGG
jgi:hypothetical protein